MGRGGGCVCVWGGGYCMGDGECRKVIFPRDGGNFGDGL